MSIAYLFDMLIFNCLLAQFIFSPLFIAVFMCLLVTLEGKPSLVVPKLKQVKRMSTLSKPFPDTVYVSFTDEGHLQQLQEWFSSLIANWQLWISFQFLNFYFVPQKLQVQKSCTFRQSLLQCSVYVK